MGETVAAVCGRRTKEMCPPMATSFPPSGNVGISVLDGVWSITSTIDAIADVRLPDISPMKKTLIVLGSIFLVLVILAIVGIGIAAVKGNALDEESKAYVDNAVPAIISGWDQQQLVSRASPEFMQAVNGDDLDKLFGMFHRLGAFKSYDGAKGSSNMSVTNTEGKVVSAVYIANATFDTGPATIKISLIKHDNWQIAGFHVDSKFFLER